MAITDLMYGDAPHPDFAVLKEKDGLEWWEWKRPEDGVLQIQLTGKGTLTDAETDRLAGHFLDDSSYVILASEEDVDVYRPVVQSTGNEQFGLKDETLPEERLVLSFRKGVFPREMTDPAYKILRHAAGASKNRGLAAGFATAEGLGKDPSRFVSHGGATAGYLTEDGYLSNTSESNQVYSGIVGHFNSTPRNPYCRQTSFTRDRFDEFMTSMPFIQAINDQFKLRIPTRWGKQRDFIRETKIDEKGWVLGNTVFSTITVNKNYRTGVHKDAGDFLPGFGNLTVLEGKDRYEGGRTVFPKYRIAVDLRTGDFIGMDVHEWHGNTPLRSAVEGKDDWERISVVCYVRVKMAQCGSVEEETEKFDRWSKSSFKTPAQRHKDLIRTTEQGKVQREEAFSYLQDLLGGGEAEPEGPDLVNAACPHHLYGAKDPKNCRECEKVSIDCFLPENLEESHADSHRHLPVVEEDVDEDDRSSPSKPEPEGVASCPHNRDSYSARSRDCKECEAAKVGCFEPKPPSGVRPRALWIVGEPGSGKTTLVRALVGDQLTLIKSPKWTVAGDFALAGHYTGATFDGADTVNYAGADQALEYWENHLQEKRIVIFDGDRFSHEKAKARVAQRADLLVLHLLVPEDVAAARRKERGSDQNAAWVKGRKTKSDKFAKSFPASQRLTLDSTQPTSALVQKVQAWLNGEGVDSEALKTEAELESAALSEIEDLFR